MAKAESVWSFPLSDTPAGQRMTQAGLANAEIHRISGLDAAAPLIVSPATRTAGAISQALTTAGATTTLTRTA